MIILHLIEYIKMYPIEFNQTTSYLKYSNVTNRIEPDHILFKILKCNQYD